MISNTSARDLLQKLFWAAVAAADPRRVLPAFLPDRPEGRTVIVGAGKGAAQMAAAFEQLWEERGNGPLSGVVVTCYGFAVPCRHIDVLEAGHPVPDENGLAATQRLMAAVENLSGGDLVVALVCGGASALLPAPLPGMSLADDVALNRALLGCGAPIRVMNAIRKQFSQIKGGRLASLAHPAKVVSLLVSDIPGDHPAMIGSGPTVPDCLTLADALRFVEDYRIPLPGAMAERLETITTVAPGLHNADFARDEVHIVASAGLSLEAAARAAERAGVEAAILSDAVEGEAREVAHVHAAVAREVALRNRPFRKPAVLLSGGETSVTLRKKDGRGGRNSEFLLSLALDLEGVGGISALAADTDGVDGSQDNAGAFYDSGTLARMREQGADPRALLNRHAAWTAFAASGDLFVTGPTGTNVNDFRAILIV